MASKATRQGSAEKVAAIPHTRLDDERQLEEIYEIRGLLGEGSFGVVKEVCHIETGKRWACKAINKEKAGGSKMKLLEREVAILKRVQHDHIICLKEVFETAQKMYLVMELCEGGELSKYLQTHGPIEETEVKKIMSRLADSVAYLHKNDMVHRDLKLENILLSPDPNNVDDKFFIKVTDFGLSVVKGGVGHENMMLDFCGTPLYMAPEILDNKAYGQLCDVWAMGIIMYILVTGTPPFQHSIDKELFNLIRNADIGKLTEENIYWKKFSQEAKTLIQGMLNKDPAHRLSASEVRDHPWITGKNSNSGPKNVLQMMKEWGSLLGSTEDISTVNGRKSASTNDLSPREDKLDDSDSSIPETTEKKGKATSIPPRIAAATKDKTKLEHTSTDPNLLKTGKDSSRQKGKSLTPKLSKSPNNLTTPTRKNNSRGQLQGSRPTATSTVMIAGSTTPSSRASSSQSSDQNHKQKKKISR